MVMDAKQDSFNISTGVATTTQAITGVGFQPKAVVFWWSGNTSATDAVTGQTALRGQGFAVSATDRRCQANYSGEALTTTRERVRFHADACIIEVNVTITID